MQSANSLASGEQTPIGDRLSWYKVLARLSATINFLIDSQDQYDAEKQLAELKMLVDEIVKEKGESR